MEAYQTRFEAFIEALPQSALSTVDATLRRDYSRSYPYDAKGFLWHKCLLLVTQNFLLQRRRLHAFRKEYPDVIAKSPGSALWDGGVELRNETVKGEQKEVENNFMDSERQREFFNQDVQQGGLHRAWWWCFLSLIRSL